jgi:hypothetical protein
MGELKPKLTELFQYMDRTRAALEATVADMNTAFAEIKPRDGSWSAAQILAHLAIVETRVLKMVRNSIDAARAEGSVGMDSSDARIVGTLDHFQVTDAVVKRTAPTTITPDGPRPVDESLASLEASRVELKEILTANADIDLHSIKRPHPLFRELDMYQWALFAAEHEERHRKQIERTLAEVTELAAESAPIV